MISFTKMHGIGNDYIYIDARDRNLDNIPALAVRMSDRHFGVGGDGIILVYNSDAADFKMRIYNADGSEAEMCGNGIRCFAKFVYDRKFIQSPHMTIETLGGIKTIDCTVSNGRVQSARVDMGIPVFEREKIPMTGLGKAVEELITLDDGTQYRITAVSMGNPHCVVYIDNVNGFPVETIGKQIENHPMFPKRTNVEFVTVVSTGEVVQRTWERGSGETLACGTGASAVCAAGVVTGRTTRKLISHLKGGDLLLEWDEATDHLFKTGPAEEVFSGEYKE